MSLIGRVALGCVGPPGFRAVHVGTVANGHWSEARSAGRSSAYGGNPRSKSGERWERDANLLNTLSKKMCRINRALRRNKGRGSTAQLILRSNVR